MKELRLTRGKRVIVDDDVFDWVHPYNWSASKHTYNSKSKYYAVRNSYVEQITMKIYLHKLIAGAPADHTVIFKNKDERDCRRENLKIISKYGKLIDWEMSYQKSKFSGVKWDMYYGMWEAFYLDFHIGYFPYELDAANAFNKAIEKAAKSKVSLNNLDFIND